MSKRKVWIRPASSGWDDDNERVVPERKGLSNQWPSPIRCRLNRDMTPEKRRQMDGKRPQRSAKDWKERAEMHARNLAFAQEHSGLWFGNRKYYRREQSYRLRHIRNSWNNYLRMRNLEANSISANQED